MPGYYPTSHKSGKARIATALPTGSRKTLHPSDNRHCASSAKNTHENRVAAIQRKAKTNTCEQGKSDQLPCARGHIHTLFAN
jgi:hypothetical protein